VIFIDNRTVLIDPFYSHYGYSGRTQWGLCAYECRTLYDIKVI
jgi:hypothetical protein